MMQPDVPPAQKRKPKHRSSGNADPASPEAIARAERDAKALALRVKGKSLTEIAVECEYYDASHAGKAIATQLRAMKAEPAAELAALYVKRLEMLLEKAWAMAEEGNLDALRECRSNVMDTAKLLGLVRTKVDVDVQPQREQMWERVVAWLTEPTPELEQVLERAGWVRVTDALPARGEEVP